MKKSVFPILFFVILFSTYNVNAQDRRNEIRLGVGIFSTSEFIDALSDMIVSAVPIGAKVENASSIGAWHVGYRYLLTDRWAVGGSFIFDYETADAMGYTFNSVPEGKIGEFQRFHYTLGAEVDYKYIARKKFALYSSLGVGATLYQQTYKSLNSTQKDSDNIIHFNFQVTPIGLRYGNIWGGFFEVGFGYKGIVNIGMFYSL